MVQARRPHLTADEKATIKGGDTPGHWPQARTAQMDRDGRWTLRRGKRRKPEGNERAATEIAVAVFGYETHVGTDVRHGCIRTCEVTDAAATTAASSTP